MPAGPTPPSTILINQRAVAAALLEALRPHWRNDRNLPARIEALLRADRRFGSRDRRLYRELIYTALRHLPWIEARPPAEALAIVARLAADLPATRAFRDAFGREPLPAGLAPDALLLDWLRAECPAAFTPPVRDALLARAPLWLRLQTDRPAAVEAEFAARSWAFTPSDLLPGAWKVAGDPDVTRSDAYAQGLIEIQDLGSQLVLATLAEPPAGHWLDACAGAGGKTLQLAHLLGPEGRVTAHDIRSGALAELKTRARRAGLDTIVTTTSLPDTRFDGVLVDAPCTGTGTWRRAPHLKWTTTPEDVARAARLQADLLARFSRLVRPGGRLVYATCSLCRSENEAVIARFLAARPAFAIEPPGATFGFTPAAEGLTFLPGTRDNDGFFVATLRRG